MYEQGSLGPSYTVEAPYYPVIDRAKYPIPPIPVIDRAKYICDIYIWPCLFCIRHSNALCNRDHGTFLFLQLAQDASTSSQPQPQPTFQAVPALLPGLLGWRAPAALCAVLGARCAPTLLVQCTLASRLGLVWRHGALLFARCTALRRGPSIINRSVV